MELLERHFEIALETPDGIKKLRELILSLAMKGKLVLQDPEDQPASELLKEIESEKAKLIKEGKIKKQEPLPSIKPEDIPYVLPSGWEWVRLNNIFDVRDGTHDTPKYENKGFPLITSKNIYTGDLSFDDIKYISKEDHLKIQERSKVEIGDILFAMIGSIGNPVIVNTDVEFSIKNVALFKYYTKNLQSKEYLLRFLIYAQDHMKAKSSGAVQSFVSLGFLRNYLFPLPPRNEQKRIVAKIDQLMALCDKLEAERNERDKKKLKIHSTAMNRLLSATDSSVLNNSWKFITKHFSELYSVTQNVDELKKAILQLAVMGKLVPQDPKDQPAIELLKEIESEKAKLIKEGRIRKQEPLPPIKPEEIPYQLPKGWEWVRFFNINLVRSELVKPNDYLDEKQIAPDSIEKGSGLLLFNRSVLESGVTGPNNRFYKGQILYSKIRPSLSKAVIAPYNGLCSADMYPIESFIHTPYMLMAILSELFLEQVRIAENRVKMPKLNLDSLGKFVIPLPPIAEQKRIVEKKDQLMDLCNSLEQQITDSTEKKSAILNAVLARM